MPTLSAAFAETPTVPEIVAPACGAETDTVGAVVSAVFEGAPGLATLVGAFGAPSVHAPVESDKAPAAIAAESTLPSRFDVRQDERRAAIGHPLRAEFGGGAMVAQEATKNRLPKGVKDGQGKEVGLTDREGDEG
jgi:hypothetical protein